MWSDGVGIGLPAPSVFYRGNLSFSVIQPSYFVAALISPVRLFCFRSLIRAGWGDLRQLWSILRVRLRYMLAVLAGLLLAAAFPNLSIAGLAWIAPGLMLAAACGCAGKKCFRIGFVAGFAFWLVSLNWLLNIPVTGFPILGWVALSAYNALFQGVWVWLCWKCFPAKLLESDTPLRTPHSALRVFCASPRLSRLRWTILCALIWVALEMIRTRFLSGFPWNLLGSSQYQLAPLLHIASFMGVYGVSFLVVWTSVSLLCAVLILVSRAGSRSAIVAEVFLPLLVVAIVFATGYHRITHTPSSERSLRVTVVQPSIPQTMIWDSKSDGERFAQLLALSKRALSNETDVLLWPEAGVPALTDSVFEAITNLAVRHDTSIIFGADDVQLRPGGTNQDDLIFFNAAWLISPRGGIVENYHKQRLVIFGEYVPLAESLPFVKWLTPITGGFTAGTNATPFLLRDANVNIAPLICFEDCFPHGAREHVTDDTDLLVNLTNDGWFGEGSEQRQHAANAVFRAIENGLPLIRSCNNGLTCWVDANGVIRETLTDERGGIYGAGFATFIVPIQGPTRQRTFYSRHGDVFGWACVALAVIAVVWPTGKRR